jgi:hypothetical protein
MITRVAFEGGIFIVEGETDPGDVRTDEGSYRWYTAEIPSWGIEALAKRARRNVNKKSKDGCILVKALRRRPGRENLTDA